MSIENQFAAVAHGLAVVRRALDHPTGWTMSISGGPEAHVEVEVEGHQVIFRAEMPAGSTGEAKLMLSHRGVLLGVRDIDSHPQGFDVEWSFSIADAPERV